MLAARGRIAGPIILTLLAITPLNAKVLDKSTTISGLNIHYKVVLPADFDPAKPYPAILAFPPGDQTEQMVMSTLQRNWAPAAPRRGYLVFVPAAPVQGLFSAEGARAFPGFLNQLLGDFKIRDNKFHIAGMSNGGISAFHIAASYPQFFWSVTVFPGLLQDPTPERIAALANMCINMHAGEFDAEWLRAMQQQSALFRAKGYTVNTTVEKGQYHVIGTLTGDGSSRLFEEIENSTKGCKK